MGSIMFRERTHLAPPESQFAPQTDGLDARQRIQAEVDHSDGHFFKTMEWSMVFEKKPL